MDYKYLLREPIKKKPQSLRAARLKSSNTPPHVYRMNFNESPYGISPKGAAALAEAIKTPYVYPDWFGIDLKTAICKRYKNLSIANIVTGAGSSALIDMLGEIFINPGDEVILGDPSYEAFRDVANDFGATPVMIPMDANMKYDLDAMLGAINEKTKMVVICNPNNPTGTYIDSAEIEAFVKKVPKHVISVIDEAYYEFVEKEGHYSLIKLIEESYENPVIVLRTFSKMYGLAGIRIGYSVMHEDLADHFSKSSHAWNVSKIGQVAAAAAIEDDEHVKRVHDIVVKERNKMSAALKDMNCTVYETQANFILFKAFIDAATLQAKLAEADILIGAPAGFNRVSIGLPEMNEKFISVMKEILA